jgi:TolA-binding protein
VLKDYPRTLIIPEAMYRLADLNSREGRAADAQDLFRKLADDFPYTEWGKRAAQRLRTAATR